MVNIFSPCGIVCDECDWFNKKKEPHCEGCTDIRGRPSWGHCDTYACVEDRGIQDCGECKDFPCPDFMNRYDPSQGAVDAVIRAGVLAYRRKHGQEAAKLTTKKVCRCHNEC